MSEPREFESYPVQESAGLPRWLSLTLLVLAVLAVAGIGAGIHSASRASAAEEQRQALAAEVQSLRQSVSVLSERLKGSEQASAAMQENLDAVTQKLKITETDLNRTRRQTRQISDDYSKRLTEVQDTVRQELSAKASSDELNSLSGEVGKVRGDLDATRQNLQMARGELGTLIARNHEEIEQLKRLGLRDYFEFTIAQKGVRERIGNVVVELRGTDTKRHQFTVALYVDDIRSEKKNRSINEPIYFYVSGVRAPLELVVNRVEKNKISGYLSAPKSAAASPSSGL
jgi:predicted  nucleic acid-binding Zn-ribbon protein